MAKKHIDKTPQKREAWVERTMEALQLEHDETIALLRSERQQSIRLNPLRGSVTEIEKELCEANLLGKGYSWCPDGFALNSVKATRDHSAVESGRAFIQNAASWLPVLALDPREDEFILDVCAAPGGKTSHIAALTDNKARIWANDNSRARLAKLQANMLRLGAEIERYTLYDATQLARKIDGQQFDKILLDAPCSGEGLMNLQNDKDFATWSVAHIKRLQQLQKRILTQAWQLLKPGGVLVYSTCTMAPEENEAVVDYLLRGHEDAKIVPLKLELPNRVPAINEWNNKKYSSEIEQCVRLKPSENIEAFFVCKLKKLAM